jgi:hypothetical protein
VAEGTKAQKSMNEIDKLLTQAKNFYQDKADTEGRGRFPGQDKYNERVGGHADNDDILSDLINAQSEGAGTFTHWGHVDGLAWRSVFGTTNADAYNGGTEAAWKRLVKDAGDAQTTGGLGTGRWSDDTNTTTCTHCTGDKGTVEWLTLMGNSAMASPFQDGHFIYAVEPGQTLNSTFVTCTMCAGCCVCVITPSTST